MNIKYFDEGKKKTAIKDIVENFEELRAFKEHIGPIDVDFFFEFADYLINRNKELEEDNKKWKRLLTTAGATINTINCIPKSKVREKIEELENDKLKSKWFLEVEIIDYSIDRIKELLQEGDK